MITEVLNQRNRDVSSQDADINVVVTVTANAVWCYSEYSRGRTIPQIRPGFPSGAGVPPTFLVTFNFYDTAHHHVRSESRSVEGVYAATLFTYDLPVLGPRRGRSLTLDKVQKNAENER